MNEAEQPEYSIKELLGKVGDTTASLSAVDRNKILQGDASTMFEVGKQYFDSDDYENAAEWYKKASLAMHPEAQIELGQLYYYGKGVPISFVNAYHWYTMQIDDPLAQYYLGVMHEQGDSAMYVNKARAWFECSAENGCIEAQYKAGEMNAHQSFNSKYRLKAIRYLTMAANNGHKKAITALKGMTLLLGDSQVEQDQNQKAPYSVKKPKKTVSEEYLKQLQDKVEASGTLTNLALPVDQSTTLLTIKQPEQLQQLQQVQQVQQQVQQQAQQAQQQEQVAIEGEVQDLESYLADFTEAERKEYMKLMKNKAAQEKTIALIQAELEDFDDRAFELVQIYDENEKVRQRNRKMEELFYDLGAALNPKRALMDEEFADYRSKKART